jgi:predicted nucleic acid-binding protein
LQEFYVNATAKLRVSPAFGLQIVEQLCQKRVVQISPSIIVKAIDTSERYLISFWDALIVEAAVAGGCQLLYTEDLNHGQKIRGVLVHNPFI